MRPISRLLPLLSILFVPIAASAAPESAAAYKQLSAALSSEQADALKVTWTRGAPTDGTYQRLRIESGRAALERCEASCAPVGAPLALSAGEKSQLISRLRGAELASLRDSDPALPVDRQLDIAVSGAAVGQWRLPRAEWPTPPDGYGLADYLDELGRRIEREAQKRPLVPIPGSVAELRGVRLKLHLHPRLRPGGVVIVEGGRLRVMPEEGSVARQPRPQPVDRPLSSDEEDRLLGLLLAAKLDDIDAAVPKRGQPAIGDEDGRIATLHLLPIDATDKNKTGKASPQPRGYERYLADLQRSAAGPLLKQLVTWLVSDLSEGQKSAAGPGTAAGRPQPSGRAASPPQKAKRP
jgi:hypothetical protein